MAAELFSPPAPALDSNANPYSGAKWKFYLTGTLTPQAVYADADLNTSLGSVVTADGAGRFVPIYFDAALSYRGICENASGSVELHDIDPINTDTLGQLQSDGDGAGAGLIIFNPSATYQQLTTGWNMQRQPVPFEYFGAVADYGLGNTANDAAAAAAIDYSLNIGGATILCYGEYGLEGTASVVDAHNTVFQGGNSRSHGFNRLGSNPTESVFLFGTDSVSSETIMTGGGLRNLYVDAKGLSPQAVHIQSMINGYWADLFLRDGTAHSWLWNCLDDRIGPGSYPCDNQNHSVFSVRTDNATATSGHGITLSGSANGAANPGNTSLTNFVGIRSNIRNGHALNLVNADGIDLFGLNIFRPGGSTGKAVMFCGDPYNASNPWHHARDNTLYGVEWAAAGIEAQGTDTVGVLSPSTGNAVYAKIGNGGQVVPPVIGTGAELFVHYPEAMRRVGNIRGVSVDRGGGETQGLAAALAQVLAEKNYSHWFYSAAENHIGLGDGTNEWVIRIASGDMSLTRIAGSGSVQLGTLIKAMGGTVSVGAADSGGTGFKVLRIPN
jgi:hypothetical protein